VKRKRRVIDLFTEKLDHSGIVDECQAVCGKRAQQVLDESQGEGQGFTIPKRQEELLEEQAVEIDHAIGDEPIALAMFEKEYLSQRDSASRDR
jgi:hypothetical protein